MGALEHVMVHTAILGVREEHDADQEDQYEVRDSDGCN